MPVLQCEQFTAGIQRSELPVSGTTYTRSTASSKGPSLEDLPGLKWALRPNLHVCPEISREIVPRSAHGTAHCHSCPADSFETLQDILDIPRPQAGANPDLAAALSGEPQPQGLKGLPLFEAPGACERQHKSRLLVTGAPSKGLAALHSQATSASNVCEQQQQRPSGDHSSLHGQRLRREISHRFQLISISSPLLRQKRSMEA